MEGLCYTRDNMEWKERIVQSAMVGKKEYESCTNDWGGKSPRMQKWSTLPQFIPKIDFAIIDILYIQCPTILP